MPRSGPPSAPWSYLSEPLVSGPHRAAARDRARLAKAAPSSALPRPARNCSRNDPGAPGIIFSWCRQGSRRRPFSRRRRQCQHLGCSHPLQTALSWSNCRLHPWCRKRHPSRACAASCHCWAYWRPDHPTSNFLQRKSRRWFAPLQENWRELKRPPVSRSCVA